MNTSVVCIGGKDIEVPNHEIPSLIRILTDLHYELLMRGAIAAAPRDGYMTYDECEQILAELFSGRMLRVHAGNLWGGMCRLTRFNTLHFETKCTICERGVEEVGIANGKTCYHTIGSVGYRMVLIRPSSIKSNLAHMLEGSYRQVGRSIKSDYLFVVTALSRN